MVPTTVLRPMSERRRNRRIAGLFAGVYAESDVQLVATGCLSEISARHDIEPLPSVYAIVVVDPSCGEPGHRVGDTPTDL